MNHERENRGILWLAQGLGLGRCPVAPGTAGSLGGVLWFLLLIATGRWSLFLGGLAAGLAASVYACGQAERLLNRKDPSSVVLDEITAMPLAYLAWVWMLCRQTGSFPNVEDFFAGSRWIGVVLVFGLFRLFDVVKPWPVGASQCVRGGWGVTLDDVLAALYTALLTWVALRWNVK